VLDLMLPIRTRIQPVIVEMQQPPRHSLARECRSRPGGHRSPALNGQLRRPAFTMEGVRGVRDAIGIAAMSTRAHRGIRPLQCKRSARRKQAPLRRWPIHRIRFRAVINARGEGPNKVWQKGNPEQCDRRGPPFGRRGRQDLIDPANRILAS